MLEAPSEVRLSPLVELFSRGRLLLILGIFLAELAIFAAGLLTPLSSSSLHGLANETNRQFASVQSVSPPQLVVFIFTHNLSIAAAEMIPVFGAFLFVLSAYSTGLATQAIVAAQGLPGITGIVLFAFPYSYVELSAYAIAAGSGAMVLVAWRKKRLRLEVPVVILEAVLVAGVLIVAAAMETLTKLSFVLGFALWVPTAMVLLGLIMAAWRRKA
jgi:hypothetical protein